jgi:subtilisin family serine protease
MVMKILGIILGFVLMSGTVPMMSFSETVEPFSDYAEIILSSDTSTKINSELESTRKLKFDDGFYDKIQNEIQQNNLVHQCLIDAKLDQVGLKVITSSNTSTGSIIPSDVITDKNLENLSPQCVSMLAGKSVSSLVQDYGYHEVIIMVPKIAQNGLDAKTVAKNNKDSLEDILKTIGVTEYYKAQRLSFITAKIPVGEISKLSDYNFVGIIGDGEQKMNLELDQSKQTISALNLGVTGKNVKVAVIDTGIRQDHPDLPVGIKIMQQLVCTSSGCTTTGNFTDREDHGTHVAGIIAGLGSINQNLKGVAYDATLFNMVNSFGFNSAGFGLALDKAVTIGAQIINTSFYINADPNRLKGYCVQNVVNDMVDETIDEGVLVVKSAGNSGSGAHTITNPGCGYNVIATGNLDDKNTGSNSSDDVIEGTSSRGPTNVTASDPGRIKPEIVAPGTLINSTSACTIVTGKQYSDKYYFNFNLVPPRCQSTPLVNITGTSFAAPHVTGTAALILEQNPYYNPLEVKSALLLGANWKSISIATATSYDSPGIVRNNMNDYGFGVLNASKSLSYAKTGNNIIHDHFTDFITKEYTINVVSGDKVKVILSWLHHPSGMIPNPTAQPISNMDLRIRDPSGGIFAESLSTVQNNEFIVFTAQAGQTGTYKIQVIPTNIQIFQDSFVLASTKSLSAPCPSFPSSGIWTIYNTCIITGIVNVPSNLDVRILNKSDLIISNGATLNVNFASHNLKVIDGSRVIVKQGGTLS